VDVRGALAERVAALDRLPAGVAEMMVLCTCHRIEIIAALSEAQLGERSLGVVLTGGAADVPGLYLHWDEAAVRHLSRVAAGLDSLIVGEAEVSGQIRRAAAEGRKRGLVGPVLERVLAGVLRAGGRARAETQIGRGTLSAATAAVSLLERAWGSVDQHSVLVVGAGLAGRQTLGRLRKRRASRLLVASRSLRHATDAARRSDASVVELDRLSSLLAEVDGVIVATRSAGFLIDSEACRSATGAGRRLHIVDLSMPRAVDPAVSDVPGVTLETVDDLGDVVRESVRRREREIPAVERIVADESARTYQRFRRRADRTKLAIA
jgi:glutamyl-tRNA reductase